MKSRNENSEKQARVSVGRRLGPFVCAFGALLCLGPGATGAMAASGKALGAFTVKRTAYSVKIEPGPPPTGDMGDGGFIPPDTPVVPTDVPSAKRERWEITKPCYPLCLDRSFKYRWQPGGPPQPTDAPTLYALKPAKSVFTTDEAHGFAGDMDCRDPADNSARLKDAVKVQVVIKPTKKKKKLVTAFRARVKFSWDDDIDGGFNLHRAGTATARYKGRYVGAIHKGNGLETFGEIDWLRNSCTSV